MAEATGIGWTRSTFNPWIGCTKVGPGCDACYAEAEDARRKWAGATHWGAGVPRMRTSEATWRQPRRWNEQAKKEHFTGLVTPKSEWNGRPGFWPLFPSLCDPFDNEIDPAWRKDLWQLIDDTPYLTWQLVTKRVSNVAKMLPDWWNADHGRLRRHVWIIATVVNQDEFDRDWPRLREIPATVRGLSIEPMLGPIKFSADVRGLLHWAIYGGESKQGKHQPRECRLEWILDGIEQCRALGVTPFAKQGGTNCTVATTLAGGGIEYLQAGWGGGKRADPSAWPKELRIQEFPI